MGAPEGGAAGPAGGAPGTDGAAGEAGLVAERRRKLARLREAGWSYPNDFDPEDSAAELARVHGGADPDELKGRRVAASVAGRIVFKRVMGKAAFFVLRDMTGRIQVYLSASALPAPVFADCKSWDLGDIIGCRGLLFFTKTGELTVGAEEARLLVKALRPLPEKYHGLVDHEKRHRMRHVSLMVDEGARDVFAKRSRLVSEIRSFFSGLGFLEVETPMMHPIPGGALAKPFVTHHNALDRELYLRVAPELYLKRLVIGGLERVFEINRNFRNEGISPQHNPEFTMLEYYMAYARREKAMGLTEEMLRRVVPAVTGSDSFDYQGARIDVSRDFARLTPAEALVRHAGWKPSDVEDPGRIAAHLAGLEGEKAGAASAGEDLGVLQYLLFEKVAEHALTQPTFIVDLPSAVSPLSRRSDADPAVSERFEFFVGGLEVANGFSELNDPEVQAEVFREQARKAAGGDEEAMRYDTDYIQALEHGMPPTVGEGVGIDRLAMLLTDSPSIRDVILFPLMREPGA